MISTVLMRALVALCFLAVGAANAEESARLLLRPLSGSAAQAEATWRTHGLELERRLEHLDLLILRAKAGQRIDAAIQALAASPAVALVVEEKPRRAGATMDTVPGDPNYSGQWNLDQISMPQAWDIRRTAPGVIVAVVDSGVQVDHPDLADNLWRNQGEIPGNGIDDDGNGYVDDVYGINTVNGNTNIDDKDGHGTSCAGIIGARGDNGIGIAGICWEVQLMAVKAYAGGSGTTITEAEAIEYALAHGADIISCSWGNDPTDLLMRAYMQAIEDAGAIGVFAAGNAPRNTDLQPFFPGAMPTASSVVVTGSDNADELVLGLASGPVTVDLTAPTVVPSTIPGGKYRSDFAGTSAATPHVAGVLALMMAEFPSATPSALIQRLLATVDPITDGDTLVRSGGRLNAWKALSQSSIPADDNDAFAARRIIPSRTAMGAGCLIGATREPGEPVHGGDSGGHSLWWSWSPVASGWYRVSTAGSSVDTLLAVYTGSSLSALTLVAENDDAPAAVLGHSEVLAYFTAGTTYALAVDGKGGATGGVAVECRHAGDDLAQALPLSGTVDLRWQLACTYEEQGEPLAYDPSIGLTNWRQSAWYSYTAAASGSTTIRFSELTTALNRSYLGAAVWSGESFASMNRLDNGMLATSTSNGVLTLSFSAVAGTTYRIQLTSQERALAGRLRITPPSGNTPPSITVASLLPALERGQAALATLSVSANDNVAVTGVSADLTLLGGPSNASCALDGGVWRWSGSLTPPSGGTWVVPVTARDASGGLATHLLPIHVGWGSANLPPSLTLLPIATPTTVVLP